MEIYSTVFRLDADAVLFMRTSMNSDYNVLTNTVSLSVFIHTVLIYFVRNVRPIRTLWRCPMKVSSFSLSMTEYPGDLATLLDHLSMHCFVVKRCTNFMTSSPVCRNNHPQTTKTTNRDASSALKEGPSATTMREKIMQRNYGLSFSFSPVTDFTL